MELIRITYMDGLIHREAATPRWLFNRYQMWAKRLGLRHNRRTRSYPVIRSLFQSRPPPTCSMPYTTPGC